MSWDARTAARASNLIYGIVAGALAAQPDRKTWLVPANACDAVYLSVLAAGAEFEVIDIDPESFSLDPALAGSRLDTTAGIGGVVYIHGYGSSGTAIADLGRIRAAAGPDVVILDDRCLCAPAVEADPALDGIADAVIYSTGYGKVLDLGRGGHGFFRPGLDVIMPEAGAIRAAEVRLLDVLRQLEKPDSVDIAASDLLSHWLPQKPGPDWADWSAHIAEKLPQALKRRDAINDIYRRELPADLALPDSFHGWRFNLLLPDRDRVLAALFEAGLFASAHYHPYRADADAGDCPAANRVQGAIINLFNDSHFSTKQALYATKVIKRELLASERG